MSHSTGKMGAQRFSEANLAFYEGLEQLEELNIPFRDLVCLFPIYVGHVGIGKLIFFYELYKQCQSYAGHIADLGTWKGASFFTFAKFVKLFEPHGQVQVHGFDYFKGMVPDPKRDNVENSGLYSCKFEDVAKIIELQHLSDVAILHNLDLTCELDEFFKRHPYLRFKLVFLDCGIAKVLEESLKHFWPRLVPGGILILDHYNSGQSPSESEITDRYVGSCAIRQFPFNRQPSAYVIKS